MPLIELWRSNPDGIKSYAIRQVVAIAGDGRIRDQSMCAVELRSYLRATTSGKLAASLEMTGQPRAIASSAGAPPDGATAMVLAARATSTIVPNDC